MSSPAPLWPQSAKVKACEKMRKRSVHGSEAGLKTTRKLPFRTGRTLWCACVRMACHTCPNDGAVECERVSGQHEDPGCLTLPAAGIYTLPPLELPCAQQPAKLSNARLGRAMRPDEAQRRDREPRCVSWRARPRTSRCLTLGAGARPRFDGRGVPDHGGVRTGNPAVLRHRIVTNLQAEAAERAPSDLMTS